ncbi:MAG: preprotein translocase subunit SecG [Candidatus Sumerlaeia bacterium]|nr:preprotein translocase subunit SecG [Candidatus Sumerlaeia bacterium]
MTLLGIIVVVATVAFLLLCGFLIMIVLVQPGKAGGLASLTSQQIEAPTAMAETLGIGQSDKLLFNWTMGGAILFFVLTFVLTFLGNQRDRAAGQIDLPETPAAATVPAGGTNTITIPVGDGAEVPAAPAEEAPATP